MDKLNQALDAFTAGLRSDPEVQLDARQQMKSKLEEKIAEETAKGHSSEECIDLVINALGSSDNVANSLFLDNLKRMKSRSRVRLVIRLLLIPAIVICAILTLCWSSDIMITKSFLNSDANFEFSIRSSRHLIFDRWTPEQAFILLGCLTEDEYSYQQKEIWKKYPDNKIYAANYILSLLMENDDSSCVLAEIEKAKKIDPDNAFYNYAAAGIMLKNACGEKEISGDGKASASVYRFEIKDRTLLEKAIGEYLDGTKKKYCCSYNGEMLKIRRKYFGEFNSLAEQFEWLSLSYKTLTPKFNYKSIVKFLPEYANILINEGKKDEALRCLNSWQKYIEHISTCFNGNSILDALIIASIASIDKEKLPPLYEKLGLHKLAQETKVEAENLCAPVVAWKEKQDKIKIGNSKKISERGGIFASMLLPTLGREFTDEELAPERYAEYIFMKKIEIAVVNIHLILGMIFALGFLLCWKLRTGRTLLTLMPPLRIFIKIIGISIVLPYILYYLFSKIEFLSGYNSSLTINSLHYAAQSWLLFAGMITALVVLSKKYVVSRCKELNVEIPSGISRYPKILWVIALGWFALAMFIPVYMMTGNVLKIISFVNGAAHTVISVVIIWYAFYLIWVLFGKKKYAFYYGALAKIMILNFALAVIVLSLILRPLLNLQEEHFIKEDQIMFGSAGILPKAEEKLTMELKDAISAAISKKRQITKDNHRPQNTK